MAAARNGGHAFLLAREHGTWAAQTESSEKKSLLQGPFQGPISESSEKKPDFRAQKGDFGVQNRRVDRRRVQMIRVARIGGGRAEFSQGSSISHTKNGVWSSRADQGGSHGLFGRYVDMCFSRDFRGIGSPVSGRENGPFGLENRPSDGGRHGGRPKVGANC